MNQQPKQLRAELLARLAAERANLLYQLRGLSDETLAASAIVARWAPKDLLAHIGYWDAYYARRIGLVLAGQRSELERLDEQKLAAANAAAQKQFAGMSPAEAMALCLKERRGFLMILQQAPDALLQQRLTFGPGWRGTMAGWVRWRHRHDAIHAADLARWRQSLAPDAVEAGRPSSIPLKPLLSASRREFLALASLVPANARGHLPVDGRWTLKDILGHLADYEAVGIAALLAVGAGKTVATYKTLYSNYAEFNEARAAAHADDSWPALWESYRQTRQGFLAALAALPDSSMTQPINMPWAGAYGTYTPYAYALEMAGHEHEHAGNLRSALGLRPLPRRIQNSP